jgi:hypothetical protein
MVAMIIERPTQGALAADLEGETIEGELVHLPRGAVVDDKMGSKSSSGTTGRACPRTLAVFYLEGTPDHASKSGGCG